MTSWLTLLLAIVGVDAAVVVADDLAEDVATDVAADTAGVDALG